MITRVYICDACEHSFEKEQGLHDKIKKKCPLCGKHKLYQDLSGQYVGRANEPSTVGHIADKNTQKMGRYELEDKRATLPTSKKKVRPWYNKDGENLNKKLGHLQTKEQVNDYIFQGKK